MSLLGTLEIQFLADIARLRTDMDAAKNVTTSAMKSVQGAVGMAKQAFVGFIGIASVGAFAGMIKGAIDTAGALNDLAIQTGASVESLSAMTEVGKLSGVSIETIAGAMNKMSKGMAVANEESKGAGQALKALGIDFDSFQSMSPDDQMMTLAKAMGEFEDGGAKSAVAMALMGREGAKMLPFMADLAVAGDLVATTTKEQAAMADNFGDNLTRLQVSGDAWKRELALGILPALDEGARAFLAVTNETGGLRDTIRKLAADGTLVEWGRNVLTVLSYLMDAGQITYRVFESLVKFATGVVATLVASLTGVGEALMAFLRVDFNGARDAMIRSATQIKTIVVAAGEDIAETWGSPTLGQKFRERMADIKGVTEATEKHRKELKFNAAQMDEASKAREKEGQTYRDLKAQITAHIDVLRAENKTGEDLTETEKKLVQLQAQMREGKIKLTEEHWNEIQALMQSAIQIEKDSKARDQYTEAMKRQLEQTQKVTQGLDEEAKKQKEANEKAALGEAAYLALTIQRDRDRAALLERNLGMAAEIGLTQQEQEEYRKQITALQALADAKEKGIHIKAAQESAAEWKKTTESIQQGLTDALYRAFESGKDFFSTLWQGIKNTFKTTILKVAVQAVMNPVNMALGSLMGVPGAANAATSGGMGDMLGIGSFLSSVGGSLGSGVGFLGGIGDIIGGAIGAGTAGTGIAASIGNALGSITASLGPVMSVLGPLGLAAGALYAIFGKDNSGTPHAGGMATADRFGANVVGNDAWFNQQRDPKMDEMMLGTAATISKLLNSLGSIGSGGNFAVTTAYADDSSKDPGQGQFRVSKDGQTLVDWGSEWSRLFSNGEAGIKEYLNAIADSTRDAIGSIGLPEWAKSIFDSLGGAPTLEQLAQAADTIMATHQALAQLSDLMSPLGGVFSNIAGLSNDAAIELIGFAGGIEALVSKTRAYVSAFYTAEEQAAITASQIKRALEDAGIDPAGLSSKADFRAAVDAIDVSTEAGRRQFVTMLDVSAQFAQIADALAGRSLADLAAAAPGGAVADTLSAPDPGSTLVSESVMTIGEKITDRLVALQESSEAGAAGLAGLMLRVARRLEGWDDADAMNVRVVT